MNRIKAAIRDWLRGYSDADVVSVIAKLDAAKNKRPWSIVPVTRGEWHACRDERVWNRVTTPSADGLAGTRILWSNAKL